MTHELRILKDEEGRTPVEAYRRAGLPLPSHTVETPLEPGTKYFWTVRAWFWLNGKPGRTQWACSRQPFALQYVPAGQLLVDIPLFLMFPPIDPCRLTYIPHPNYFRFNTPLR